MMAEETPEEKKRRQAEERRDSMSNQLQLYGHFTEGKRHNDNLLLGTTVALIGFAVYTGHDQPWAKDHYLWLLSIAVLGFSFLTGFLNMTGVTDLIAANLKIMRSQQGMVDADDARIRLKMATDWEEGHKEFDSSRKRSRLMGKLQFWSFFPGAVALIGWVVLRMVLTSCGYR